MLTYCMPKLRSLRTSKKMSVSGSEPTFTLKPYGTPTGIRSNNCTAYALQKFSRTPGYKLQPGELSKQYSDFSLSSCSQVVKRTTKDLAVNKLGYRVKPDARCEEGYAKIMLLLDPNTDFHFLRQNGDVIYRTVRGDTRGSIAKKFRVPLRSVVTKSREPYRPGTQVRVVSANVWSHKRGTAFGPDLTNARGDLIFDPRKSDFKYGNYDYDKFCAAFCVKQKPCTMKKKISGRF